MLIRAGIMQRGLVIAGLCLTIACGDDDDPAPVTDDGGVSVSGAGAKGGTTGGGSGGRTGSSGSGGRTGSSGSGGRPSGASGSSSPQQPGGECLEPAPTGDVTCGGEVCTAPTFENNACVVPCCVNVGGEELCGAKSTLTMLPTDCALPAKADPQCPDVEDGMGGSLAGCCNADQKKCGIISSLRPGCITESQLITLPDPLQACTPETVDDGDAGIIDTDSGVEEAPVSEPDAG